MKILAIIVKIDLISLFTISRPNAIPGFSIKVRRKKLSITSMLEPGFIPFVTNPRKGRLMPFTRNLLTWSAIIIANETNKILKLFYPRRFLHSIQCCVIGTSSSLSFGISGQVSQRYFGSSMQSMHNPYVPWSMRVRAS